MNLLCNRLLANGYNAAIITEPDQRPPFRVRYLTAERIAKQKLKGRDPIVVYPEVTKGNPFKAKFVVRFLLNKPGLLVPGSELEFEATDYFIAADPEFVPGGSPGLTSSCRSSTAVFTSRRHDIRRVPGLSSFPIVPTRTRLRFRPGSRLDTIVSMGEPRSHSDLADLYRRSRAMVIWERSSAIHEALMCGCPVICIGNESFNQATYQARFRGGGHIWGWHQDQIETATRQMRRYRQVYRHLERNLDRRIRIAFNSIITDARRRSRGVSGSRPGRAGRTTVRRTSSAGCVRSATAAETRSADRRRGSGSPG